MKFKAITNYFCKYRDSFLEKSPREKWITVRGINIILLKFIGCEFMEAAYKLYFNTCIPMCLLIDYFAFLLYTLVYYRHQYFRALQATATCGLTIPAAILYVVVLIPSSLKQYQHMYNFAGDYIYANNKITPKNNYVCDRMAIHLVTSSSKIISLLFFAAFLACLTPNYKTFVMGETELIVPVIVPFVNPDSELGFFINCANQSIYAIFGPIIICGTELITCVLKNCITSTAAVIENSLEEFADELHTECWNVDHTWHFQNIIVKIMDFNEFIIDLGKLYYWKFFLQPGILMYAIVVSLFLYLADNWSSGIGYAVCNYIQLFILCDVGKTVNDANNSILSALNRFPFYLMPTEKQKLLAMVVSRMQNGGKIKMGPLSELNYETATQQTKITFNLLMVMLRTLK